ncbi:hypothetical protein TWF718_007139 [Orbilia javanica]|uniref:Uncharacterized protein n=1 Tax=Orbilia javanica TaxID=47235 RepID=A0AAN8MZK8_9PEZI
MYADEFQRNGQDIDDEPSHGWSKNRILKVAKGPIGAGWFCFANLASFVFIFLVFLGNIYPSTTMFGMISIDLHPQYNKTLSLELYRADNYTGTNPLTNRIEQPRYLYLGFSGRCNIYDNNSTDPNQYSKECTASFVQPLILPGGAFQEKSGKSEDAAAYNANVEQANHMWRAIAAFMILIIIYNAASVGVVCAGKYEFAFKYLWIAAILLSVPPAVLGQLVLSKAYGPISLGPQLPELAVALNKTGAGQCLGMVFFSLAVVLTFVAHPILLLVAIVIVGIFIAIMWFLIVLCFRMSETGEERLARKSKEERERLEEERERLEELARHRV